MSEPRPFTPARSLGRVLQRLGRLAGALVPLQGPKGSISSLLAEPLARFSAPPPGEGALLLALARLERQALPAAEAARRARSAFGIGALTPTGEPGRRALVAPTSARSFAATLAAFGATPAAPRRAQAPAHGKAAAGLPPALEAFARRVAGGKAAAASPLAPDGVAEVLAHMLATSASAAYSVAEAAGVAPSRPADEAAEPARGAPALAPLAEFGRIAAGATARALEATGAAPGAAATADAGMSRLLSALAGAEAAAPTAAGARPRPETGLPARVARADDEGAEPAAGFFAGRLGEPGQLERLVRRWQPDAGGAAVRTERQPAPSVPAQLDTEAFARTLERVLTAEARRHGITVESG